MLKFLASAVLGAAISLIPFAGNAVEVYGYYGNTMGGGEIGLYDLSAQAPSLKWADSYYSSSFATLKSGWMSDGKLCALAPDFFWGMLFGNAYVEIDLESGEILSKTDLPTDGAFMLTGIYNPSDGIIYAFGKDSAGTDAWLKATPSTLSAPEVVATLSAEQVCQSLTYNTDDCSMYAVNPAGALVKVAPDGTQTVVAETNKSLTSGANGLAYDSGSGLFYWCSCNADWTYTLNTINPDTGETMPVEGYANCYQYDFLIIKAPEFVPVAQPVITLTPGELGANLIHVALTMPNVDALGEPLVGTFTYNLKLDGTDVNSGTLGAAESMTTVIEPVETGEHVVIVTVTDGSGAKVGELSQGIYVGPDVPVAPAIESFTSSDITWTASAQGTHGGYIDSETLTYVVTINGKEMPATSTLSMATDLVPETGMDYYEASVAAINMGIYSMPSQVRALVVGEALDLPSEVIPTERQFKLCSTVDGNGDGYVWSYNRQENCFDSGFGMDSALEDWLYLPPMQFDSTDAYYSLQYDVRRRGNTFSSEYLSVYLTDAPTVEAETQKLLVGKFTPSSEWTIENTTFRVPSEGKWYVAFRCQSAKDQYGIWVKNVTVEDSGVRGSSPAQVTDLTATAGENGKLEALVTFRMPTLTLDGEPLSTDAGLTAKVSGLSDTEITATPGQEISAIVQTAQGNNYISVQISQGEAIGPKSSVEVYTGVVAPQRPQNLMAIISEDMKSVDLSWDAPQAGVNGGYIDPAAVTYTVKYRVDSSVGSYWETIADGVTDKHYTFVMPNDAIQDYFRLSICANTVGGQSADMAEASVVLGKLYTLPMEDDFNNPATIFNYEPWVTYMPTTEYNTRWGVLPYSTLPSELSSLQGNALVGQGQANGCLGMCGFPAFTTKGSDCPTLEARIWTGDDAPEMWITGRAYGMDSPVEVAKISPNGEWFNLTVELPAQLQNTAWVQLFFNAAFPNGKAQWVIMDNYTVNPVSSVNTVHNAVVKVQARKDGIRIVSNRTCGYSVHSVTGQPIDCGQVCGEHHVNLASGLYIVKAADTVTKVMVQ